MYSLTFNKYTVANTLAVFFLQHFKICKMPLLNIF